MVLFLYSDIGYEYQAINCIKSLTNKITDDIKLVYYTIGFDSQFDFNNLYKYRIDLKAEYPQFNYYKAELSLLTMNLFPDEHYVFADADILFSKRFDFEKLKHSESYPIASFGPHEYPFNWETTNQTRLIYDETALMNYFNVPKRSQRYVWSCFYSFNQHCKEFFEEYMSICKNKYLLDRKKTYLPFSDETAFNICLWKRGADKNYGFSFVNTHKLDTVIEVEGGISDTIFSNKDLLGGEWEYVKNASDVMFYHGFKNKDEMEIITNFLINS